jgi:hypothetical protein
VSQSRSFASVGCRQALIWPERLQDGPSQRWRRHCQHCFCRELELSCCPSSWEDILRVEHHRPSPSPSPHLHRIYLVVSGCSYGILSYRDERFEEVEVVTKEQISCRGYRHQRRPKKRGCDLSLEASKETRNCWCAGRRGSDCMWYWKTDRGQRPCSRPWRRGVHGWRRTRGREDPYHLRMCCPCVARWELSRQGKCRVLDSEPALSLASWCRSHERDGKANSSGKMTRSGDLTGGFVITMAWYAFERGPTGSKEQGGLQGRTKSRSSVFAIDVCRFEHGLETCDWRCIRGWVYTRKVSLRIRRYVQ